VSTLGAIRILSNHGRFTTDEAPKVRRSPKFQRVEVHALSRAGTGRADAASMSSPQAKRRELAV
jgi:hypothetical protein